MDGPRDFNIPLPHPTHSPSLQDLTDAGNLGRAGRGLASMCTEALSFNEATDTPRGPTVWLAQEWGGGRALGEEEGKALPTPERTLGGDGQRMKERTEEGGVQMGQLPQRWGGLVRGSSLTDTARPGQAPQ